MFRDVTPETSTEPKPFTLEDLARLLESLPHPDDEYFDDVEHVTNSQPTVEHSRWD